MVQMEFEDTPIVLPSSIFRPPFPHAYFLYKEDQMQEGQTNGRTNTRPEGQMMEGQMSGHVADIHYHLVTKLIEMIWQNVSKCQNRHVT